MTQFEVLSQILAVTAPVFSMVVLGLLLKRMELINEQFIQTASALVFKATMPTLFFLSLWKSDIRHSVQFELLAMFGISTLLGYLASWLWAMRKVTRAQRGVFVQGSFRGNCGVMSFALASSYFGDFGSSVGGVLAGFSILIFNVLSVLVLSVYSSTLEFRWRNVLKELATNPLVVAVVLGMAASWFQLELPVWVNKSANYFADLTLPLALICVGGTLSWFAVRESGVAAMQASMIKLLLLPVGGCLLAWLLGFRGRELVILWVFLASPTAAGSFSMAMGAGADGRLAANIIALSTFLSIFTVTLGMYGLSALGH
ncbi:AEC family transporter [Limnobacter humi]|uniref:AEC family transporter n=1 Tax=Limnobacter humi TaxID=1778671 RepID=A0ABT1WJS2_9BURK|nr:AEC family transporter [Limnobacter humi]MCQ8896679.1 AEC family transporter [Limnobacter humi]